MDREPPILEPPVVPVVAPRKGWWKLLPFAVVAILIGAVIFVARYEPVANKQYYPQCGFKQATGLDCPGCGGLRATHAITRGRIIEAARFHPGFVLSLPIIAYLGVAWLREWRRIGEMPVPLGQPECNRPLMWVAILLVTLGMLRNIPTPPFSWLAIPTHSIDVADVNATIAD